MEKLKLVKRGVYKRVNKRTSPNIALKKKIEGVQELIGQLREMKSAQKFHDEEYLRPRLRMSMLVREVRNVEKNIISSTPHHTKDPNNQHFFGKNLSVLLSPISQGRRSSHEKKDEIDEKNTVQKTPLQRNCDDASSEIGSNNIKNVTVGTETDQDQQILKISSRKSKKDQSINRSKIENKTNTPDPKMLKADKSFDSHEQSHLKGPSKSTEKSFVKSPVKLPSAQQAATKKSRIPLRTASQEKERALEVNNNLQANKNLSLDKALEDKCLSPKRKAHKTHSVNRKKDTAKNVTDESWRERKAVSLKSPDKITSQDKKDTGDLNANNQPNRDESDKEQLIISVSSSNNSSTHFKENNKKVNSVKKSKNVHDKTDYQSTESFNDELDHDRTEFVNKTPRRRNNEILPSQELHKPVCNKNANISIHSLDTHSPSKRAHLVNKSRVGATRCKPADGLGKGCTKSIALSPIRGQNEKPGMEILQNTRLEKSVGVQVASNEFSNNSIDESEVTLKNADKDSTRQNNISANRIEDSNPLSNLIAEISAKKNAKYREIQTSTNNKRVEKAEDTNPLANIIAEISTRKSYKNKENQTSLTDGSKRLKGSRRKDKFISLAENGPEGPVMEVLIMENSTPDCNPLGCTKGPNSDSDASSGLASGLLEKTYNFGYSIYPRGQLFETLEEGNELDAFNLSDPGEVGQSPLHNETMSNQPWRFVGDSLVPEILPIMCLRNSKGYLGDSNDSSNSSFGLKSNPAPSCNTTACDIPTGLRRTILNRTAKRQYNKRILKTAEEPVDQPRETVSSSTLDNTLVSKAKTNKNVSLAGTEDQSQNAMKEQSHWQSDTDTFKRPSEETLTMLRSRQYNKKILKVPVHQPLATVSTLTPEMTSKAGTKSNKKKYIPLEGTGSSGTKHQTLKDTEEQVRQNDVKASKRSKEDNVDLSLASSSSLITDNLIVSISSADQQLLGIKPLSPLASSKEQTDGLAVKRFSADANEQVSSKNKTSHLIKKTKPIDIVPDLNIQGKNLKKNGHSRSIVEVPSMDSEIGNKKSNIQHLDEQSAKNGVGIEVQNNTDRSSLRQAPRSRTKKTKRRGSTLATVHPANILPILGEGRPQRNRKPVRFLTDIIINDEFLMNWDSGPRKRLRDISKASKQAREEDSGSKKREKQKNIQNEIINLPGTSQDLEHNDVPESCNVNTNSGTTRIYDKSEAILNDGVKQKRRPGRPKKTKMQVTKDAAQENVMKHDDDQSNMLKLPKNNQEAEERTNLAESCLGVLMNDSEMDKIKEKERKPILNEEKKTKRGRGRPKKILQQLTTNKDNLAKENIDNDRIFVLSETQQQDQNISPHHGQVGQLAESESMPPPQGCSVTNLTCKVGTKRKLTSDSGFETININNTNKNSRTSFNKGSKKTEQADCVRIANIERTSEELRYEDDLENTPFSHPAATTETSLSNTRIGCATKTNKKRVVPKDVIEAVPREFEPTLTTEQNIDGSRSRTIFSQLADSDYVNYMVDGELHVIRYAYREEPTENDYKSFGNLDVTQTVKHPKGCFSAGYIRLQPGDQKRPTITTTYSFSYFVVKGSALLQCENRTSTIREGGSFVVAVGMEYLIQNMDPHSDLVMYYTKFKTP